MAFETPFHLATDEHEGVGHVCLSRVVLGGDPDELTWGEFWDAFVLLATQMDDTTGELEVGGQVLFYMGRHVIELTLKRCSTPTPAGHDLVKLLAAVPAGHPLQGTDPEADELRQFVQEVAGLDPGGDQGRYGRTRQGAGALADTCCMEPMIFTDYVQRLVRLAGLL
jgi:hypothetical protein